MSNAVPNPDDGGLGKTHEPFVLPHHVALNEKLWQALSREDLMLFEHVDDRAVAENGEHVVLTMADPCTAVSMSLLVDSLVKSPDCKRLTIVAGGVAAQELLNRDSLSEAQQVTHSDFMGNTLQERHAEMLRTVEARGVDVLVTGLETDPGPSMLSVCGETKLLDDTRLFVVMDSYDSVGELYDRFVDELPEGQASISGILATDELAVKVARHHLDELNASHFHTTGTGYREALDIEHADEHRRQGLKKLGLTGEEKVMLFLGDISGYPAPVSPDLNEQTFAKTLEVAFQMARENGEEEFALLIRPHPRDPRQSELYEIVKKLDLPSNLKVIKADRETISLEESAYGADILMSTTRTELMKAPLRGRLGIYLGFGDGLGGALLSSRFSEALQNAIHSQDGIVIADSPASLAKIVSEHRENESSTILEELTPPQSSSANMLQVLFRDR